MRRDDLLARVHLGMIFINNSDLMPGPMLFYYFCEYNMALGCNYLLNKIAPYCAYLSKRQR